MGRVWDMIIIMVSARVTVGVWAGLRVIVKGLE